MKRREAIRLLATGSLISVVPISYGKSAYYSSTVIAGLKKPTSVYISWAAHDELSDNIPLTEELAMRQFNALLKLKNLGVQFDYYLMDMFWFDKTGGFREFKKEGWPNGPDSWLKACRENGIKPGLWLSTNIMGWTNDPWIEVKPEWKESGGGWLEKVMSFYTGGFLKYHIETMQMWYDKGVRMFKFDFASFDAAPKSDENLYTKEEIIQKNEEAWLEALKQFRNKNPEVVLLAYNGYGGQSGDTFPIFSKTVNLKWLEVFDSLYCGDPRAADVPCHNFWRSKDIYSDHMVRQYEFNGVPLERIDNTAFMIGNTGTCYYRKKQSWKGMMILSAARGGWMNTYYGNLDLLDETDGKWFAKVQSMFFKIQAQGKISSFGNIPGTALPYCFMAKNSYGCLLTFMNPSQKIQKVAFPVTDFMDAKILFTDKGYKPKIENNSIFLGPEQMALVGLGMYSNTNFSLGIQEDVIIPSQINPISTELKIDGKDKASLEISYNGINDLRIVFTQKSPDGRPIRVKGGAPPDGIFMSKLLNIKAYQKGKEIPLSINYDKQIWSGLSWAVAEIQNKNILKRLPLKIEYFVTDSENRNLAIDCNVYEIKYN